MMVRTDRISVAPPVGTLATTAFLAMVFFGSVAVAPAILLGIKLDDYGFWAWRTLEVAIMTLAAFCWQYGYDVGDRRHHYTATACGIYVLTEFLVWRVLVHDFHIGSFVVICLTLLSVCLAAIWHASWLRVRI